MAARCASTPPLGGREQGGRAPVNALRDTETAAGFARLDRYLSSTTGEGDQTEAPDVSHRREARRKTVADTAHRGRVIPS